MSSVRSRSAPQILNRSEEAVRVRSGAAPNVSEFIEKCIRRVDCKIAKVLRRDDVKHQVRRKLYEVKDKSAAKSRGLDLDPES